MQLDRRLVRASNPETALAFFLDAERERRSARALVLGTLDGRVIAGAGELSWSKVAAAASLKLHGLAVPELLADLSETPFSVTVVKVAGQTAILTGVDGVDSAVDSSGDLERILGMTADLS